jgi:uncharacterized protein YdiU (UPF0061 family)
MPYAHNYAGHQFGYFVKQLGDGRAASLGEVINQNGRWELQLKGSGKTAYSRQGDGRAVLRSSIREYLASAAMESLGIPTTQAIVIITTTDTAKRDQFYDGNVIDEPMAMVLRVAPNFIRFGSFERFFYDQKFDLVEKLANYSIYHFFPQFINMQNRYELFYKEVANLTATMIAHWQAIGFAHGVMNTDNMSILGITIDYGPFQFLDNYDEDLVPNTSDDEGRYAFGKQPSIAGWNLEKLGKALSPLFQSRTDEIIGSALSIYVTYFNLRYYEMMKAKLGLHSEMEGDDVLIQDLLKVLKGTDYSISVRTADTTSLNPGFTLVEKTVWYYANGGTWSNTESIQTLVMGGSGTSGTLRYRSGSGEEFLVALGVHNYKRWCDIVTDLAPGDTCMKIHPKYYEDGTPENAMLWKQLSEIDKKSKKGTNINVKYVEELEGGKAFIVHITIS